MSIKRWDGYSAVCDWPGCEADVMDGSDYSAWGEVDHVKTEIEEAAWWSDCDGERHYCNGHPAAWASDSEQVEATPPPYLLIHDGDTDDPHNDDGKVTLIGGAR